MIDAVMQGNSAFKAAGFNRSWSSFSFYVKKEYGLVRIDPIR